MRPGDEEIADILRRGGLPVVVAANKIDSPQRPRARRTTSTASGSASRWPSPPRRASAPATCSTASSSCCPTRTSADEEDEDVVRLAVIGRPNVGKSSLVNAFLGRERVIVSDVAGTTRDAIDTPIEVDGRQLLLVDTAGIRRAAKVSESVEYYTTLRSQRAAERADVALVVCDATDGVTSQDLRIAELAMKSGCATALVLNKWDLTGGDDDRSAAASAPSSTRARAGQPQAAAAPAGADRVGARPAATSSACCIEALSLADRARTGSRRPELNRFLGDVVAAAPAAGRSRATG